MPILSIESRKKNCRFIGGYLPIWLHEYLALYTTAKGCSNTSVLRTLLEDWIRTTRQEDHDQLLIMAVATRLQEQWNVEKGRTRNVIRSFEQFKRTAEEELLRKGIKPAYVKLILVEVKQ